MNVRQLMAVVNKYVQIVWERLNAHVVWASLLLVMVLIALVRNQ